MPSFDEPGGDQEVGEMTNQSADPATTTDEAVEMIRTVATSSARLWEEILDRLVQVAQAQSLLAETFTKLQAELAAPRANAALAAPATGATHDESGEASVPVASSATESQESAPTLQSDGVIDTVEVPADRVFLPPPPPPPNGFGLITTDFVPPPPPGFVNDSSRAFPEEADLHPSGRHATVVLDSSLPAEPEVGEADVPAIDFSQFGDLNALDAVKPVDQFAMPDSDEGPSIPWESGQIPTGSFPTRLADASVDHVEVIDTTDPATWRESAAPSVSAAFDDSELETSSEADEVAHAELTNGKVTGGEVTSDGVTDEVPPPPPPGFAYTSPSHIPPPPVGFSTGDFSGSDAIGASSPEVVSESEPVEPPAEAATEAPITPDFFARAARRKH
jgi:hypothetical protein